MNPYEIGALGHALFGLLFLIFAKPGGHGKIWYAMGVAWLVGNGLVYLFTVPLWSISGNGNLGLLLYPFWIILLLASLWTIRRRRIRISHPFFWIMGAFASWAVFGFYLAWQFDHYEKDYLFDGGGRMVDLLFLSPYFNHAIANVFLMTILITLASLFNRRKEAYHAR